MRGLVSPIFPYKPLIVEAACFFYPISSSSSFLGFSKECVCKPGQQNELDRREGWSENQEKVCNGVSMSVWKKRGEGERKRAMEKGREWVYECMGV